MIRLFQFSPNRSTINYSPYCLKLETHLKMAGLPYESVALNDPRKAPKKKLPYIEDEGKIIADSGLIIDYLSGKYGNKLDMSLTVEQQALALGIRRMLEDHFIYALLYFRWVDQKGWDKMKGAFFKGLPFPLSLIVPEKVRKTVKTRVFLQGMGAHSREEIARLGHQDILAIATLLENRPYFFGEKPTSIDAVIFAFMNNIVNAKLESPLKTSADMYPVIKNYCDRIRATYYPSTN